jgi:hypothetical protein
MRRVETARQVPRPFRWDDFGAFDRLAYTDPDLAPPRPLVP